jgi:hypothetical protein
MKALKNNIVRNSFLIEPVNATVTSTKMAIAFREAYLWMKLTKCSVEYILTGQNLDLKLRNINKEKILIQKQNSGYSPGIENDRYFYVEGKKRGQTSIYAGGQGA